MRNRWESLRDTPNWVALSFATEGLKPIFPSKSPMRNNDNPLSTVLSQSCKVLGSYSSCGTMGSVAFLSANLHPTFQKYFCFFLNGTAYMFLKVPFGLTTAPWAFSRLTIKLSLIAQNIIKILFWCSPYVIHDLFLQAKDK